MITAQSKFTEEEMIRGIKLHLQCKAKFLNFCLKFSKFIAVFPIIVGCLMAYEGYKRGESLLDNDNYYLPIFVGLGLFFSPWFIRRGFVQNIRKLPFLDKEVVWHFKNDMFEQEGKGLELKQAWDCMYEAIIIEEGLLIYPQNNMFYWIPNEAFQSDREIADAQNIVLNGVKNSRRIGSSLQKNGKAN